MDQAPLENPRDALGGLSGLILIDEFQRQPDLRRFWIMAAHYHGQTWNRSAIAKSLDISHTTARSYLDILTKS